MSWMGVLAPFRVSQAQDVGVGLPGLDGDLWPRVSKRLGPFSFFWRAEEVRSGAGAEVPVDETDVDQSRSA